MPATWVDSGPGRACLAPVRHCLAGPGQGRTALLLLIGMIIGVYGVLVFLSSNARAEDGLLGSSAPPAGEVVDPAVTSTEPVEPVVEVVEPVEAVEPVVDTVAEPVVDTVQAVEPVVDTVVPSRWSTRSRPSSRWSR